MCTLRTWLGLAPALALLLAACDSTLPTEPPALTQSGLTGTVKASQNGNSANQNRIPNGTYLLGNHPDGKVGPSRGHYGLVVTGALGPQTVFDFEADGAEVLLTLNPSKIAISGIALAYVKTSSGWMAADYWQIDFQYKRNLSSADENPDIEQGGWTDIRAGAPDPMNAGTLTNLSTGVSHPLSTKANSEGWTFQLGDEGGNGHRLGGHDLSAYDTDYSPGNSGNSNGGGNGNGDDDEDDDDAKPMPVSGWGWIDVGGAAPVKPPTDFLFIIKGRNGGSPPQDG